MDPLKTIRRLGRVGELSFDRLVGSPVGTGPSEDIRWTVHTGILSTEASMHPGKLGAGVFMIGGGHEKKVGEPLVAFITNLQILGRICPSISCTMSLTRNGILLEKLIRSKESEHHIYEVKHF